MRVLALVLVAGCGRIGFDTRSGPLSGADASIEGTSIDAFDLWDAAAGCQQGAPFLYLIDTHEYMQASQLEATWCAAGLPGPVTATLYLDGMVGMRDQKVVAIDDHRVELYVGGASCMCFTRLEANGVIVDGPVAYWPGD